MDMTRRGAVLPYSTLEQGESEVPKRPGLHKSAIPGRPSSSSSMPLIVVPGNHFVMSNVHILTRFGLHHSDVYQHSSGHRVRPRGQRVPRPQSGIAPSAMWGGVRVSSSLPSGRRWGERGVRLGECYDPMAVGVLCFHIFRGAHHSRFMENFCSAEHCSGMKKQAANQSYGGKRFQLLSVDLGPHHAHCYDPLAPGD
jgi:hypothetical protein